MLTDCFLVHSCSEGQKWLWGGWESSSGDGRSNQVCSMLLSSRKQPRQVVWNRVFRAHLKFSLVNVCLHQSALWFLNSCLHHVCQPLRSCVFEFNAFAVLVFGDPAAEHCVEFPFDCVAEILKKSCPLILALMLSSLTFTASATNLPLASKWNQLLLFWNELCLCCDLFLCSVCL